MNYVDIIILVAVCIGVLIGISKGLVAEVAGLVALVVGIVGARMMAPELTPWIGQYLDRGAYPVAWLVCFVGFALAVNAIGWILTRTLEAVALGCVNKLLGGIFGGIKYILLFSVLFNLVGLASEYIPIPGKEVREQSMLYEPIKKIFKSGRMIFESLESSESTMPAFVRADTHSIRTGG